MTYFRKSSWRALYAFVLSLTFCLLQPASAQIAPSLVAMTSETALSFPHLEAVAEQFVAEGKAANMVIGVTTPNGQDVWIRKGTLAFNNDLPADEHSLYRIYSMTKMITAVAATLLIEEGKIGLDQPISDFIPAFADVQVLVDPDKFGDTRPPASPITVRHLLTHTSGQGKEVLPVAAVKLATSNLLPSGLYFNGFGAFSANNQGFGAGGRVVIDADQGEPVGTYGFGSAASTLATAIPSQNVSLIMMTQMLFANDLGMMQATSAALVADLAAMQVDVR